MCPGELGVGSLSTLLSPERARGGVSEHTCVLRELEVGSLSTLLSPERATGGVSECTAVS